MIYAFGTFELDEECYELRRTGVPVKLEPKAFRVLVYLIPGHRDRVVTRDELREQFWPGEFVTDSALAHCVVKARQAVDDGGMAQQVIKTVHGHGYRFIAAVTTCHPHAASPAVPPVPRPPISEGASPTLDTSEPSAQLPENDHRLPEGERKEVTVLCAGLKGIPALAQVLDPEAFPAALRQLFNLMRVEVQRVGDRISLVTGDALRAVFGAPIAHEDHAVRALHAALGLQQAFAAFTADLRRTQGIILTMRVGLHAGPVVVGALGSAGYTDDTALGFTSYLADGLQQFARRNAIYVSEAVRRHAEGFFHLTGCKF